MPTELRRDPLILIAHIVAAYVANNRLSAKELPALIASVRASMRDSGSRVPEISDLSVPSIPAVNPKKSIHEDYLICLEDGKKFKTLKRHLAVRYNLTPEGYRQRWGLPKDYPMVASSYAARRSALAKKSGLGKRETDRGAKHSSASRRRAADAQ
ncbi:MucR family transcriptional regulator [Rhizobium sp. CG5]|uniref:MucR family transcriptional regulator n=1 Tax=Rhizobium sp. CG5 TaxID=2726076 RepID=UPI0020338CD1|nr:MucR family transcriptional regulator [Rhizobium sp. CG5]